MFTGLVLNLIRVLQNFLFNLSFKTSCLLLLVFIICSSHSASISTSNYLSSSPVASSSSSDQSQLMSNSSYRSFVLRQYFIDLLNISHASLVRSMVYTHQQTSRSTEMKPTRRKRLIDETSIVDSPIYTLQSTSCVMIEKSAQSTFSWSQSLTSITSIELVYHIDLLGSKASSIPMHIRFKHPQTSIELFNIDTILKFDVNRDFYFVNIFQYILSMNNQNFIIEAIIPGETCQTSHTYLIVSSTSIHSKPNQTPKINPTLALDLRQLIPKQNDSSSCKLKTIQIKFEDLGLAYLIIRPKEYTFTYCDGSCSYSTLQHAQPSMHALFQSMVHRKNPAVPPPTCSPSQFADDNFLLRQMDGSIEIYPIKDVIVRQCACL